MSENQNDQRNQQAGRKSHQEHTQEGKKKTETNPNNPTANQISSNSKGQPNTDQEKDSVEETAYDKNTGNSDGKSQDNQSGNQKQTAGK